MCENNTPTPPSEEEMDFVIPPLEISTENLIDVQFNDKEFQKGLNDISFIAGQITGLVNCGIEPIEALGFIINRETIKHNIDSAVITKDMNIEMSKNQVTSFEKTQL